MNHKKIMKKDAIIGILVLLFLVLIFSPSVMSGGYDIIVIPSDTSWYVMEDHYDWLAQSFEVVAVDTITQIDYKLNRYDTLSGQYSVRLKTDSGGEPGSILFTGTYNLSGVGTSPSWFGSTCNVDVTPGVTYWIEIVLNDDQAPSHFLRWNMNTTNPYPNGHILHSDDGGSTWTTDTASDFGFRIYGNIDPTACFTHSEAGLVVDVDAGCSTDSDGTITTYQWDWTNDGSYDDTGETQTHIYSSGGTYTIKLRVIDNDGGSDTKTHSVTVSEGGGNVAPTAAFTTSTSGLTVNVDGSGSTDSDGTIVNYQWDWTNDGNYDDSGASATASHTYSSADTYTIKLRVVDNGSATDTITHQVTVSTGGGSSGFSSDYTMWYLIAGVAVAIIIGVVVYLGPVKKKHGRKP